MKTGPQSSNSGVNPLLGNVAELAHAEEEGQRILVVHDNLADGVIGIADFVGNAGN